MSPGFGKGKGASSSTWTDVVQGARTGLARFASPLASSRWQARIVSYRIVSCRIVPYRIVPYRIVSYRIVSYRVVSYRVYGTGQG